MSQVKKQELQNKIDKILSIEELEERLEMNTLAALGSSYNSSCFNGNTVTV